MAKDPVVSWSGNLESVVAHISHRLRLSGHSLVEAIAVLAKQTNAPSLEATTAILEQLFGVYTLDPVFLPEFCTTEDMLAEGGYGSVNRRIESSSFPLRGETLGMRRLQFMRGDVELRTLDDLSSEAIVAWAKSLGFEQPTPGDAMRFGIQFPGVQLKSRIVWLHEPVEVENHPSVIVLGSYRDGNPIRIKRDIDLRHFTTSWSRHSVFPFVFPAGHPS